MRGDLRGLSVTGMANCSSALRNGDFKSQMVPRLPLLVPEQNLLEPRLGWVLALYLFRSFI